MDSYSFYGEVGRGASSTVYKGRQRQTVEYVAIKSVELSNKARVLNEVAALFNIAHENVLKFKAWYETSNHVWLVVEFCAGGSLRTLLDADGALPSWSVRELGADVARGLAAVHARGYVHCDVKPSSVLISEDGVLKLCGFGLARRVPPGGNGRSVPADGSEADEAGMHGTPFYMAPELFAGGGGAHSAASDVWALGCLLFEMAAGEPPFVARHLDRLIEAITGADARADERLLALGHEPELAALVALCLERDPAERITLAGLCAHPFWEGVHFEPFPELARAGGPLPGSPAPSASSASSASVASSVSSLPTAAPPPPPPPAEGSPPPSSVDARRLTELAHEHVQDDAPGDSSAGRARLAALKFTAPTPITGAGAGEEEDEGGSDMYAGRNRRRSDTTEDGGGGGGGGDDAFEVVNLDAELDFAEGLDRRSPAAAKGAAPLESPLLQLGGFAGQRAEEEAEEDEVEEDLETEEAPEDQRAQAAPPRKTPPAPQTQRSEYLGLLGAAEQERARAEADAARREADELIMDAGDRSVRQLASNRRINPAERPPPPDASELPFRALSVAAVTLLGQAELEAFLTKFYQAVAAGAAGGGAVRPLRYFQTLCESPPVAKVLVNSSLVGLLAGVARAPRTAPAVREHVVHALGLLLEHASLITADVTSAETGLVEALAWLLRTRAPENLGARRRAAAALGELVFYVATEEDYAGRHRAGASTLRRSASEPAETPVSAGAGGAGRAWEAQALAVFERCLERRDEDGVVVHLLARTIVNVCSQSPRQAGWFARARVVRSLHRLAASPQRKDPLRACCALCLFHLCYRRRSLLEPLRRRDGLDTALAGAASRAARLCLPWTGMLCLYAADPSADARAALLAPARLAAVETLAVRLVAHPSVAVRAKAVLLVCLLGRHSLGSVYRLSQQRLVPALARAAIDREAVRARAAPYLGRCLDSFRRHAAAWMGWALAAGAAAGGDEVRRSAVGVLSALASSPALRPVCWAGRVLRPLCATVEGAAAAGAAGAGTTALLRAAAAVFRPPAPPVPEECRADLEGRLLPALAALLGAAGSEDRFLAVRVLTGALAALRPSAAAEVAARRGVLPRAAALLADESPIPQHAVRLVCSLVDADPAALVPRCRELGLVPPLFAFLRPPRLTEPAARLVRAVVAAGGPAEWPEWRRLGLAALLADAVARAWAGSRGDELLGPLLDASYELLSGVSQAALMLEEARRSRSGSLAPEDAATALPLARAAGVLCEIVGSAEATPRALEKASLCVLLLARLCGPEGRAGIARGRPALERGAAAARAAGADALAERLEKVLGELEQRRRRRSAWA